MPPGRAAALPSACRSALHAGNNHCWTTPVCRVHLLDAGCCGLVGNFGLNALHDVSVAVAEEKLLPALHVAPTPAPCWRQLRIAAPKSANSRHSAQPMHTVAMLAAALRPTAAHPHCCSGTDSNANDDRRIRAAGNGCQPKRTPRCVDTAEGVLIGYAVCDFPDSCFTNWCAPPKSMLCRDLHHRLGARRARLRRRANSATCQQASAARDEWGRLLDAVPAELGTHRDVAVNRPLFSNQVGTCGPPLFYPRSPRVMPGSRGRRRPYSTRVAMKYLVSWTYRVQRVGHREREPARRGLAVFSSGNRLPPRPTTSSSGRLDGAADSQWSRRTPADPTRRRSSGSSPNTRSIRSPRSARPSSRYAGGCRVPRRDYLEQRQGNTGAAPGD